MSLPESQFLLKLLTTCRVDKADKYLKEYTGQIALEYVDMGSRVAHVPGADAVGKTFGKKSEFTAQKGTRGLMAYIAPLYQFVKWPRMFS